MSISATTFNPVASFGEFSPLCWKRRQILARRQSDHDRLSAPTLADVAESQINEVTDVPTNRVTQILNGRRAITGDTALRLAHFFGTTPEFWLNLQSLYEIRLAQQKSGKSIKTLPTLRRAELTLSAAARCIPLVRATRRIGSHWTLCGIALRFHPSRSRKVNSVPPLL